MMSSLFSVFEPSSGIFNLPLNWLSSFLGLLFVPYMYWVSPNRMSFIFSKLLSVLNNEFQILLVDKNNSRLVLVFISIFSFIVFNNFMGLFPYVFTSTSHLVVTLSLSLPLWIAYMLYGWVNNTKHMFAHLVPSGTPPALMPFMVLIETISNVIRPGTLAVRLAANMIAGHLLLSLMGSAGVGMGMTMIGFLVLTQILLLMLEFAVAVIQSYVFAILSTLYASEVI